MNDPFPEHKHDDGCFIMCDACGGHHCIYDEDLIKVDCILICAECLNKELK